MSSEGDEAIAAREALGRLRKLQAVTEAALEHLSLEELLDELLGRIRDVLEADTCAVLLLDTVTNELVARAAKGLEEEVARGIRIPLGVGFAGRIAAEARPIALATVDSSTVANPILTECGVSSLLGAPLIAHDRVHGVVHVGTLEPRVFTAGDVELLMLAAQRLAVAIERVRIHEELVRLERLERSFIALASHELRTPAAVIYGISETLEQRAGELAPDQVAELRRALYDNSVRLRDLVEQLLDLSRLDARTTAVKPELLPLRELVGGLVSALPPEDAAKIELEIPSELEVEVDPRVLERILVNLLVNAVRYGGPPVVVTAYVERRHLHLCVEDRGRGVKPVFVPQLFERFTRSEEAGQARGAGLGLAIARAYATAHGGVLGYEPGKPQGSCFRLTIPLRAAEPAPPPT